ncbi:TRAP transporter small permease [Fodinicurvata sp. EGI_FJ10296]|uniref:TRAP transporter small permease n=1 Tax=Fodinicurvata sp. EGI_FJ10296 TaxID=3231908 RepID=UPI003453DE13
MSSFVSGLYGGLRRVESLVLSAIMLVMVGLYGTNVGVRTLLPQYSSSFAWIDEATRILLVWSVFLALGAAMERGRHVAMGSVFERFSVTGRRWVGRLIDAVGCVFALYIAKLSFDITLFVAGMGQTSPTLGISMAWLYAVVPVGMTLLALRFAIRFVRRGAHPDGWAHVPDDETGRDATGPAANPTPSH